MLPNNCHLKASDLLQLPFDFRKRLAASFVLADSEASLVFLTDAELPQFYLLAAWGSASSPGLQSLSFHDLAVSKKEKPAGKGKG